MIYNASETASPAKELEVENPGLLPFGMTLDDLKAGVSRIRNRVIVRVLRELGLVEEWGTGYRRVTQACEEGGYPPPTWRELGSALRVIFQPHPAAANEASEQSNVPDVPVNVLDVPINAPVNEANEPVNETDEAVNETEEAVNEAVNEADEAVNEAANARQQWFIAQIVAGRQPGWADLVEQLQVSRSTAQRDIAALKARGLIEFVGAPKTGAYRLTKQA